MKKTIKISVEVEDENNFNNSTNFPFADFLEEIASKLKNKEPIDINISIGKEDE